VGSGSAKNRDSPSEVKVWRENRLTRGKREVLVQCVLMKERRDRFSCIGKPGCSGRWGLIP